MADSVPPGIKDAAAVLDAVAARGLLFLSDPKRENAIHVLTGQFPKGSWWKHPAANEIYATLEKVSADPAILLAKLLAGKVTFIHRSLWPDLLAVVTAREPWQTAELSPAATQLMAAWDAGDGAELPVSRTLTKELEARLLARVESVHTDAGLHSPSVERWSEWATRVGCTPAPDLAGAKRRLEAAAAALGPPAPALPWTSGTHP